MVGNGTKDSAIHSEKISSKFTQGGGIPEEEEKPDRAETNLQSHSGIIRSSKRTVRTMPDRKRGNYEDEKMG